LPSAEPAIQEAHVMGYRIPALQKAGDTYYRLKDETGSMLRMSVRINGLLAGPRPGDYVVNTATNMFVFTPEKFRRPEKFASATPDPRSTVVDEDVAHEKIADEPSVYAVEDNTTMSVRPAVGQIKRTGAFAPNGEPVYIVSSSPIFKVLRARPVHGG